MSDDIKLRKANGIWVLRAHGAVLGESRNAMELTEGDAAPVIYFPRADIAMVFLEQSQKQTPCPLKGEAEYFSIVSPNGTIKDAVVSYPNPPADLSAIAGHLAFETEDVAVEQL
ncbi:MAG: hypothetical protein ACJASV_001311 [Pseudorhodobacter sp.]|jgi:uncharacterized protein (DUF427 family)